MNSGLRLLLPVLVLGWLTPVAEEVTRARLERLRTMPLDERRQLEANLRVFRGLDAEERSAIRTLDAEIENLPEPERTRYLHLMREYTNWLGTLSAEQRTALESASPSDRIAMIRSIRSEPPPTGPDRNKIVWIRSAVFNPIPLFEAYYLLKIWTSLDESQRQEVEAEPTLRDRQVRLEQFGRDKGLDRDPELVEEFRVGLEELRRRMGPRQGEPRFSPDELLRPLPRAPRSQGGPAAKVQLQIDRYRGAVLRNLEARWTMQTLRQVRPLTLEELRDFESHLPNWYRQTLDPLPPREVRDRLTLLRRLVEREPELIEALMKTPAASSGSNSARPSESSRPVGGATAF